MTETNTAAIRAYAERFSGAPRSPTRPLSPHLTALEAEAIHILREVAAEFERPVMLYSIGKDSTVMLHLAMKAFWPANPPSPSCILIACGNFRRWARSEKSWPKRSAST